MVSVDFEHEFTLGFGGGCHWCTEAVFASVDGIESVKQGWIASAPPNDTFSEAVALSVDFQRVDMPTLLDIHCASHSSVKHSMREKYRSAVYVNDPELLTVCREWLSANAHRHLALTVLPFVAFRLSPTRYQSYFSKYPDKPFSKRYIRPKLAALQERFGPSMKLPDQNNGK